MAAAWFEEFFQGLALEAWRKAKTPEQTRAEADFLAGVLGGGHTTTNSYLYNAPGLSGRRHRS